MFLHRLQPNSEWSYKMTTDHTTRVICVYIMHNKPLRVCQIGRTCLIDSVASMTVKGLRDLLSCRFLASCFESYRPSLKWLSDFVFTVMPAFWTEFWNVPRQTGTAVACADGQDNKSSAKHIQLSESALVGVARCLRNWYINDNRLKSMNAMETFTLTRNIADNRAESYKNHFNVWTKNISQA
jgi:hypothetical protein